MVTPLAITAFDLGHRYIGIKEVPGQLDNPVVLAMLKLDNEWPQHDEVPWCSAFMNWICWHLHLPRSKSLLARSWLEIGRGVPLEEAEVGFDIVVLKRGKGPQPGITNTTASGHVGFYAGVSGNYIEVLGGNQSNQVKVSRYPKSKLLSVRRLIG